MFSDQTVRIDRLIASFVVHLFYEIVSRSVGHLRFNSLHAGSFFLRVCRLMISKLTFDK